MPEADDSQQAKPHATVCGARLHLKDEFLTELSELRLDRPTRPHDIRPEVRCVVQTHQAHEPHWGIVRRHVSTDPPSNIWATWYGNDQPRGFVEFEDCNADTYGHGKCHLFSLHLDGHSFELTDGDLDS